MKTSIPTVTRTAAIALLLTLGLGAGATEAQRDRWTVRAYGVLMEPSDDSLYDQEVGFGLGLAYRLSERFEVEVTATDLELESSFGLDLNIPFEGTRASSSVALTPVLARLNVHLTPQGPVDVYFGPVVGLMNYGDVKNEVRIAGDREIFFTRVETDEEIAWGGHVGLDVRLGAGSSFLTVGATYLDSVVTLVPLGDRGFTQDVEIDPFLVQVGYTYRF